VCVCECVFVSVCVCVKVERYGREVNNAAHCFEVCLCLFVSVYL